MISLSSSIQFLFWIYPCKWGGRIYTVPHFNSNLSNSHSPSHLIQGILLLQTNLIWFVDFKIFCVALTVSTVDWIVHWMDKINLSFVIPYHLFVYKRPSAFLALVFTYTGMKRNYAVGFKISPWELILVINCIVLIVFTKATNIHFHELWLAV